MDAAQNIAHEIQHDLESDGDQFLTFILQVRNMALTFYVCRKLKDGIL